jgi:hypothetical protein
MQLEVDDLNTDETQIKIDWYSFQPGEDGDSPILSYHVQWDGSSTDYTELVGYSTPYLDLTYTVLDAERGIVPGRSYNFRYRA